MVLKFRNVDTWVRKLNFISQFYFDLSPNTRLNINNNEMRLNIILSLSQPADCLIKLPAV
jgi:hypothetical protein